MKAYLLRANGESWILDEEGTILATAQPGDIVVYPGTVLDATLELKVRKEEPKCESESPIQQY